MLELKIDICGPGMLIALLFFLKKGIVDEGGGGGGDRQLVPEGSDLYIALLTTTKVWFFFREREGRVKWQGEWILRVR